MHRATQAVLCLYIYIYIYIYIYKIIPKEYIYIYILCVCIYIYIYIYIYIPIEWSCCTKGFLFTGIQYPIHAICVCLKRVQLIKEECFVWNWVKECCPYRKCHKRTTGSAPIGNSTGALRVHSWLNLFPFLCCSCFFFSNLHKCCE